VIDERARHLEARLSIDPADRPLLEQQQQAEDEHHKEWPHAPALEAAPLEHAKRLGAAPEAASGERAA
jgi:hypothetical protein